MKSLIFSVVITVTVLLCGCGNATESPMDPRMDSGCLYGDCTRGDELVCHRNMELIFDGVSQYYGKYGEYPQCLDDLALIDPGLCSLSCPSCSLEYEYESDIQDNYSISCPLPAEPDHGSIRNGFQSWPPHPSQWITVCQDNMRYLSSACAMYYGKYNSYPSELQDLVLEGYLPFQPQCPACGQVYMYVSDSSTAYSISCPLPDPNHGYIVDGICYFPPDTNGALDACRSNMLCLSTGLAMYFGKYNTYPEELKLLGTSGMMENWDRPCPACGRIYHYWTDEEGQTFVIQCPLPWDPGHGNVVDHIPSW